MNEQTELAWGEYLDLTDEPVAAAMLVLADRLGDIAHQVRNLGNADAATPMSGMEALGKVLSEAIDGLGGSISDAVSDLGQSLGS